MTSSAESIVNGTQSAKDGSDSTKTLPPSATSPTTPKSDVIQKNTKTNGIPSESVPAEVSNGNSVESSTHSHTGFSFPPTTSQQADVAHQIPSSDSQSNQIDQGSQNEEDGSPSSSLKRDLYVGNL